MKISGRKILRKTLKTSGIVIGSIVLLMFLLPMIFPGFVSKKIKSWANNAITSELNFSKARLSFFKHFPSLTLTLYDFTLKGSAPYSQDTLIAAKEVAFGVDLSTVFKSSININEIYLSNAAIRILVNDKGQANYNVYKSDTTASVNPNDSSSASLKIEKIQIEKSKLFYDDQSIPILISADNFNYTGKGDLSKSVFDLYSKMEIGSFDLVYDYTPYIISKKVSADLVTKINTHSLELRFEKNDLLINTLPVAFKGQFDFLEKGYNMDFRLISRTTNLHDVFTALPPQYAGWLDSTDVRGKTEMDAYLTGKYIVEENKMPDLGFNLKIRDGYIANNHAPSPVTNLFLNFDTKLPSLSPDSLSVNIDSIFFNIDKDYFSSIIQLKGLNEPYIKAAIRADMDLEKWNRAFGVKSFAIKGKYRLNCTADGKYARGVVKSGLRQVDTVITSVPVFKLTSSLTDGYFKYASLPHAIDKISFDINASCPDNNIHHASVDIADIQVKAIDNFLKGFVHVSGAKDYPVNAQLQSVIDLASIKQFYPVDSIDLKGALNIDLVTKGYYNPSKKLLPVTSAKIVLNDGAVKTKYYPAPIDQIQVDAMVKTTKGTMQDLNVNIKPISFSFEGQPFRLRADLSNFDNLRYVVTSRGIIDLGKIYKVFAINGYNVDGYVKTNVSLAGTQADATAGRYDQLNNHGTIDVRKIAFTSDLFPMPFVISSGNFRFDQDKIWMNNFNASYGKTAVVLQGYLENILNYATKTDAPLKGTFDVNTKYFLVDEFMAFADNSSTTTSKQTSTQPSGVVIIPANLSLQLTANADRVMYSGIELKNFKGGVLVDSGKLKLNKTGFTLIDAPVSMNATYQTLSPKKAVFDYHIDAQNFDVKKAYNEIQLFHDMASSAANAEGIVSLNYTLSGKLDENMMPVYPSLKGGGTLSLQKVKVKGLKLFSAVSKETNRDSLSNPDLSKVDIKSTISNNIITIERTKMRVFGFRPRFEGQVSFDGRLNLSGRIGLPPFGIFGIPFTVSGTQENPVVKLKRSKESGKLEETEEKKED
ncbi:AsmA-like C-terminal region-containing protein [Danxiaibacter flavus]|uniref:AsmA-like C-terminal region-containing protein n=1 Tax=Danxiaibacter flavus TaxID=3049108 RepID=A0ABV3ZGR0_9BACT|nr:AsmA-like C-terminal region-containing protein [Chitinophagaceae bacterium DXS]